MTFVILDVKMPMNGFELYDELKKVDPEVKVCFLTASSETYREELGGRRRRALRAKYRTNT